MRTEEKIEAKLCEISYNYMETGEGVEKITLLNWVLETKED